jgi:hypothetical protein
LFDSRELTEGDIFAVTMIRPGTYSVTNVHADTRGEIVVTYPKLGKVPYRPSNPITIDCTKKAFNRKEIKIAPAQGQVYHIKTRSRIKIELLRPDDGASKAKQKAARRRKKATPKKG